MKAIVKVPPFPMTRLEYGRDRRVFVALADVLLLLAECEIQNEDAGAKLMASALRDALKAVT